MGMSDVNDDIKTARGDELADAEPAASSATPDADELAEGSPRGEGLAHEDAAPGSERDREREGRLAEGNPRGDGLATDA